MLKSQTCRWMGCAGPGSAPGTTASRHGGAAHKNTFLLRLRLDALVVTQSFPSLYEVVSLQAGFTDPSLPHPRGLLRPLFALLPLANKSITGVLTEHPIMTSTNQGRREIPTSASLISLPWYCYTHRTDVQAQRGDWGSVSSSGSSLEHRKGPW